MVSSRKLQTSYAQTCEFDAFMRACSPPTTVAPHFWQLYKSINIRKLLLPTESLMHRWSRTRPVLDHQLEGQAQTISSAGRSPNCQWPDIRRARFSPPGIF